MRARKYTKRIDFYQTYEVSDGYGGYTVTDQLITSSWCNIRMPSIREGSQLGDVGINDPFNTIIISLRYRNDIDYSAINQFIEYRGQKYVVRNAPISKDFEDTEVEIIAVKQ